MKKVMLVLLLTLVTMSLFTASAYGWGSATHGYIAKELGKAFGYANLQEMYGSTLPDMVNLKNIPPTEPYESLYAKFHFIEPGSQEAIINQAKGCFQKAFVYGFASHNDMWGADSTAHHDAASNPVDDDGGYVNAKTLQLILDAEFGLVVRLSSILEAAGAPAEAIPYLVEVLAPTVADFGIETGVDFLIKRNEDPVIGLRLFFAASFRSRWIPYMLARAYSGGDLALARIIIGSEKEFKEIMKLYGQAFLLDEEAAINSIITQWIPLVSEIAQNLYPIPGVIEITEEIEQRLITLGIEAVERGIEICASDYSYEISSTIEDVGEKLEEQEIYTCPQR